MELEYKGMNVTIEVNSFSPGIGSVIGEYKDYYTMDYKILDAKIDRINANEWQAYTIDDKKEYNEALMLAARLRTGIASEEEITELERFIKANINAWDTQ